MSNQVLTAALALPDAKGCEDLVRHMAGRGKSLAEIKDALAAAAPIVRANEAHARANRLASLKETQRRVNGYR